MKQKQVFAGFCIVLLSSCAYMPTGPSVLTLPGTGMTLDQFRQDDYFCQQYAYGQVGGVSTNQASVNSQLGSAVAGSALGAAAGAAMAGGRGAAVGAGAGLVVGSMVGSGESSRASYATQKNYDNAYIQCMYAKGHRVPVSGRFLYETTRTGTSSSMQIPPPPSGTPPPPPNK